jgi:hypothetical protein
MKRTRITACLSLALLGVSLGAEGPTTWISWIDGVRYECSASADTIRKTGGPVLEETGSGHQAITENSGTLTLAEAINRADKVAREMLGEAYTGAKPIWVMRSAERCELGDSGSDGGYYSITFNPRRSLRDKSNGQANLQVIVLLNGEVLRPVAKP